MAKTKVSEWSATPGNNTDIDSINIAEGCAPSGINDAIRELMAQIKDYQTGTYSDTFNGPVNGTVGATTPSTGAFTTLSSTGNTTLGNDSGDTVTVNGATTFVNVNPTLSQGTANGVLYLNGSKVATSGSALTYNGTGLGINTLASEGGVVPALFAKQSGNDAFKGIVVRSSAAGGEVYAISYDGSVFNHTASYVGTGGYVPLAWTVSGSEQMRLTSTGLGIGTSSPTGRLDVNTTAGEVIYSSSDRSTNGQYISGLIQRAKNSSSSYVSYAAVYGSITSNTASSEAGALTFWTMSSGSVAERARIDSSGNLLVGTTSIGYIGSEIITLSKDSGTTKWSVGPYTGQAGQFYVSAGSGTGVYLSSTSATSWSSNSDERLKTDLKPIENAAQKVASLRAVTGRYKTDAQGYSRAFLIAQDVQAVLPEAVTATTLPGGDETEYLSLSYTDTIPLLTAAIQEQQTIIEQLTARVAQLESN